MEQKTTVTTENKQQDGKFKANCIDNCIQPNWNDLKLQFNGRGYQVR